MKFISPDCAVIIDFARRYKLKDEALAAHIDRFVSTNPTLSVGDKQAVRDILSKPNNIDSYHYVYILQTSDRFKSLYCGYTNDLDKRIKTHSEGKGAKFTKSRLPVKLVFFEMYDTKSKALKREFAIKQLTRSQKLNLIVTTPHD